MSYSYTLERAGATLITAKMLYKKMNHFGIDLLEEIDRVLDDAVETICGTNCRADEFIGYFFNDEMELSVLLKVLTMDDEDIQNLEVLRNDKV